MKIEDQAVSLELALEMKELGAKQDSIFYWIQQGNYINDWSEAFIIPKKERDTYDPTLEGDCSAYTVAELGEMLPIFVSVSKMVGMPSLGWRCVFEIPLSEVHNEEADMQADAYAKMWIHLKKEDII